MRSAFYSILGFLFVFAPSVLTAQAAPEGLPFISNFDYKAYGANTQNWCVSQDSIGNIYVGNNDGLLVYDGNAWLLHRTPSIVRSIAYQRDGDRVYTGLQGDFGYFERDSRGMPRYHSLAQELDSAYRDFGDVWQTISHNGAIYFQTTKFLFIWNQGRLETISPQENTFHILLKGGGKELYIKERGIGLLKAGPEGLSMPKGGEQFADKVVFALLDYAPNTYLVACYRSGLFLWNTESGALNEFPTEADAFFRKNGIYCGLSLSKAGVNSAFALGTLRGGAAILDREGRLELLLTEEEGVNNNKVKSIFEDQQGNLWMALNNGISMIEMSNPIRKWGTANGIEGKVYSSIYHRNRLYVGLPVGGYWIDGQQQAQELEKINGQTWEWKAVRVQGKEHLLVGTQGGLFTVEGDQEQYVANVNDIEAHHVFTLQQSEARENVVYLGTDYGLAQVACQQGQWQGLKKLNGFDKEVRQLFWSGKKDVYWAALYPGGIARLRVLEDTVVQEELYDSLNSPLHNKTITYMARGRYGNALFFNENGVYSFDESKESFERAAEAKALWEGAKENELYTGIYAASEGRLWLKASGVKGNPKSGIYELDLRGEEWEVVEAPYTFRLPKMEVNHMGIGGGSLWISSSEGLFEVPIEQEGYAKPPVARPQIRQVILREDSVALGNAEGKVLEINHDETPITFKVAGSSFTPNTVYRYYLENEDKGWSNWTEEAKVRYTSLFEGEYKFKVQALNLYGELSETAVLQIRIHPPLWRTPWAYLIYLLALSVLIWLIVRWNTARIKAQRDELERVVKLRTAEIQQKNEEITAQADQLREINENMMLRNNELAQQREEITAQAESLKEANHVISETNEKLTSSINYAQRIQQAVLPFEERIREFLPHHFILFKPRDIVSGDFYWFNAIDDHRAVLAVADCTGHGVPGAFMSMLGNESLSHQVLGNKVYEPSLILEGVDQDIRKSLQQSETDNKDGMEMAVCLIDFKEKKLSYAGAKQPFLYVREQEIVRIKGSRFSIGGTPTHRQKEFETHVIDLSKPITFYLSSDGYQDQFGGPRGQKFMTRKFRKLLEETAQIGDISQQKEKISETLLQWQGDEKQVDDILVVGVKISL